MRAAIVIPSLNSPVLDRVLSAVAGQSGLESVEEVLVVGRDEAGLIGERPGVRLLDTGRPVNPAVARNLGVRDTNAPLLLFLDSDCIPQPGWLQAHQEAHARGHRVVGGGVVPDGSNYWSLSYNLGMFNEYLNTLPAGARSFLPTLNLSVEREVIEQAGPLDETLPRSQDMEWTARMHEAGYRPYFHPAAAVRHLHNRTTLKTVWEDSARSGRYARAVRWQHRDLLRTPALLQHPELVRLLSPLIAGWTTLRIVGRQPGVFLRRPETIPAVYLTKIAWCWGAGAPV